MRILLVDYAQLHRASRELGVRDSIGVVARYAEHKNITKTYFWAFSLGNKFLHKVLESYDGFPGEFACSEIPLDGIRPPGRNSLQGSIEIGGTRHKAQFRMTDNDDEVDFSVRIAYAIGALSGDDKVEAISVISNAPEIIPCLSDAAAQGMSTSVAFFYPHISSSFYRAISTVVTKVKISDLTTCIQTSSIRGSSVEDGVFNRF